MLLTRVYIKRPFKFIEGGRLALVKEPFLCTLTANCRRVELLLSVSCDIRITEVLHGLVQIVTCLTIVSQKL